MSYLGVPCKQMKPTRKHRPALWECMLGTVYALNDEGEIKYFDYNWDEAIAFAGAKQEGRDPRLYRIGKRDMVYNWDKKGDHYEANPRRGKLVLWILREPSKA